MGFNHWQPIITENLTDNWQLTEGCTGSGEVGTLPRIMDVLKFHFPVSWKYASKVLFSVITYSCDRMRVTRPYDIFEWKRRTLGKGLCYLVVINISGEAAIIILVPCQFVFALWIQVIGSAFYTTNKDASTVLCSVVKYAESGRVRKKCRRNHET